MLWLTSLPRETLSLFDKDTSYIWNWFYIPSYLYLFISFACMLVCPIFISGSSGSLHTRDCLHNQSEPSILWVPSKRSWIGEVGLVLCVFFPRWHTRNEFFRKGLICYIIWSSSWHYWPVEVWIQLYTLWSFLILFLLLMSCFLFSTVALVQLKQNLSILINYMFKMKFFRNFNLPKETGGRGDEGFTRYDNRDENGIRWACILSSWLHGRKLIHSTSKFW